jgi:ribulose-5-phosphate 4-epimerase/fuculose-1-phosphate aldolase
MTTYQGIKFKTFMVDQQVKACPRIRELEYWCKQFHQYNLAPPYKGGSYGNLSCRLGENQNAFLITGSRIGLKNRLSNDCFVKVFFIDLPRGIVYAQGIRDPSSESMIHFAIYRQRKDVNAIFHGHSQEILTCADKLGVPETIKEEPYGTGELVQRVLEVLADKQFLIMKNHGFISLGKTMKEAGELAMAIQQKCLK